MTEQTELKPAPIQALPPAVIERAKTYAGEVAALLNSATELKIETSEENQMATDLLLKVANKRKDVEKAKKSDRDPYTALLNKVSAQYDSILENLTSAEAVLDKAVLAYRAEQRRIADELEAKRLRELQAAQLAAAKAAEEARAAEIDAQRAADAAVVAATPEAAYEASDAAVEADEKAAVAEVAVQEVEALRVPVAVVPRGSASGLGFQFRWYGEVEDVAKLDAVTVRNILLSPEGVEAANAYLSRLATANKRADAAPAGCRFWSEETTKKGRGR